jgi:HEAT repeat protein
MKNRLSLAIGLGVALAVGLGWATWWGLQESREPVCDGRTLGSWIDQQEGSWLAASGSAGAGSRGEAQAAIRRIGTNALPALLRMAAARDSALKKRLMALAARQHVIKFHFHSEEYYHARSDAGFAGLGAIGKTAVPALVQLLKGDYDSVRIAAAYDLMWIGPEAEDAVPALVQCLQDPNFIIRFRATRCLGHIHRKPELAVPALIQCLGQSGVPKGETIAALMQFGAQARPAIPHLLPLLDVKDLMTRSAALHAIEQIDPEAAKAGVKPSPP